ncbi:type VI secretion system tip protein VgrG [Roseateles sp. DAIF2]|uniref:type VI secretion system tip protein VgrG n=1 Tax=Roseateles sp. DAIF2 TaxID=2714952 RepID=UPI0018A2CAE7|nr:type VI secretion system tip protein VgrG [Roseateles sp. DAIF2]QPF73395.1 type VI secretion system tip protein VgrG [Roseateles sp. DAIF2]
MAAKPSDHSDGALRLVLSCDGSEQEGLPLLGVTVRSALNAIPWARITLADGDMPEGKMPLSDGALFKPGAEISIRAGYGDDETQIFSGLLVRHGLKIGSNNEARLVLECRDKACKMTLGRRSANYVDQKDSAIIQDLIGRAGLGADVADTPVTHKELVQYYCSDWDFMLSRAQVLGLVVQVADGQVSVQPPKAEAAVLSVAWGDELIDFSADIDARSQWTAVQASSWSLNSQALVQSASSASTSVGQQGNLDGAKLAAVAAPDSLQLQSSAPQEQQMLDAWAKATQLRAALARVRGRMSFQGSALAKPGAVVELAGVGARFAGSVYLSAVEHQLENGNWITQAEFGLDPEWHAQRADISVPPGAGLLPGVGGLQIGKVLKLDGDPEGENKIQVSLPTWQCETEGVWARLLQFHASSGFGAFFLPEVGDEVLLGYLNEDPCHPVVLGSLYSSARTPPYALAAENDTKALVTRCQHRFEFNEADKIITLTTPAKNQLVLDDKDKSILVKDQHGNSIKLDSAGITLDSPKDIKLSAQGGISLEAGGAIKLDAKADIKASGMNISCEAQMGLTAKGAASAELSASGQTTVKGSLVMIN